MSTLTQTVCRGHIEPPVESEECGHAEASESLPSVVKDKPRTENSLDCCSSRLNDLLSCASLKQRKTSYQMVSLSCNQTQAHSSALRSKMVSGVPAKCIC